MTYTASGLPTGLNFDGTNRRVYGTTTASSGGTVTITATDSHGGVGTGTFTLSVMLILEDQHFDDRPDPTSLRAV